MKEGYILLMELDWALLRLEKRKTWMSTVTPGITFQPCGDVQSQWLSEDCHLQCQLEYPVCDYFFIDSFHALCFHNILQ